MEPKSAEKASSDGEEDYPENSNQIVLYDPSSSTLNGSDQVQIVLVPEPNPSPIGLVPPASAGPPRVLPAVGAFTVQCAKCFKWRLIPTKEKYEEIREHILEKPFSCEVAREWKPELSCGEPGDIEQDGSRLWAIDKPSISQPPTGWERELRIRGEGSSRFADVYYIAPSGKRLRSTVEVQRYLLEHPEYVRQGVTLSQFSFQTPKPLQENYVRKRASASPISWAPPDDHTTLQLGGPGLSSSYLSPPESKKARPSSPQMHNSNPLHSQHRFKIKASPISWAPPDDHTTLQLGGPGLSPSYLSPSESKKARPSSPQMHNTNPLHNQHRFKIKGPRLPPSDVCDL